MSFLCFPPDGSDPVEVVNPNRADTFVARGYNVTDLDHVEEAPPVKTKAAKAAK